VTVFFFLVHGSNPREKLHIRAYLLAPIRRAQFDSVPQHHGYGGGRGGTRRRRGRGFRVAAGAGRLRHRLRGAPRPRRPRPRRRRLPLVAHPRHGGSLEQDAVPATVSRGLLVHPC